jgi:Tn3 transposase DDE domain
VRRGDHPPRAHDAHPEPPNFAALKAEITATWPMTSLLDMVKETDLRLGFTDALKSPTAYETLDRSILQPRLLFCLHGLGTNTGLQRMAGLRLIAWISLVLSFLGRPPFRPRARAALRAGHLSAAMP